MKIKFEGSKHQIFICFKTVLNPHRIRIPMCFKIWIRIKFKYLCTSEPRFHHYYLSYSIHTCRGADRRTVESRDRRLRDESTGLRPWTATAPVSPSTWVGRSKGQVSCLTTRTSVSCTLHKINQSVKNCFSY